MVSGNPQDLLAQDPEKKVYQFYSHVLEYLVPGKNHINPYPDL